MPTTRASLAAPGGGRVLLAAAGDKNHPKWTIFDGFLPKKLAASASFHGIFKAETAHIWGHQPTGLADSGCRPAGKPGQKSTYISHGAME